MKQIIPLAALLLAGAQAKGVEDITRINPPQRGFFSKRLDYQGIAIKAHAVVSDEALMAGRQRLATMLKHLPDAVWNLSQEGAELHIIGKKQVTSDLPDFRHMKGKPFRGGQTVDEGSRGLTGIHASCAEENLLHLDGDMYHGRDVCVHEFAHTLYEYGLTEEARKRIADQHAKSLAKGLWTGAYAATSPIEFLAELSMWYFGTSSDTGKIANPPKDGRDELRRYDADACQLLDELYSGRIKIGRKDIKRLAPKPATEEATLRSRSGAKSAIRFRNETDGELRIYWLDASGKRAPYGSVATGQVAERETSAGHVWLLADAQDKAVALFVAEPKLGVAIVER